MPAQESECFESGPAHTVAALKCQPRKPMTQRKTEPATRLMQSIARYIDRNADQSLVLAELAAQAQLSPSHLQRRFKAVLGVSPKAYQDAARLRLLKAGLKGGKSVLNAITEAGFQSTSRVYGHTTRNLGMTPTAYRAGGAGETVAYALRHTTLGPLLMAATHRGVCVAQFGDDSAALIAQLREEFPKARIVESSHTQSPELDAWIAAFESHIAGTSPRPDLPLDLRGTAFQIRVWRFLLGVAEGEVISYADVARGIGAPRAVRASASACGSNRIAVLVPCHRVIRADGGLGGYRWGLERKRLLMARERTGRAPMRFAHGGAVGER